MDAVSDATVTSGPATPHDGVHAALVSHVQDALAPHRAILDDLGGRFADAGHDLWLVGGPVRDAVMGRQSVDADLDFTTSAHPDTICELIDGWADKVWEMGREFGTIGFRYKGRTLEVTTYRHETYDPDSRKPDVTFGDTLDGDLGRRDFTVNSIAVHVPRWELADPFGGLGDLMQQVLRTPAAAEQSFSDDPLRMMRAARFVSQLGFTVTDDVRQAMTDLAGRLSIVSAERVRAELEKLIVGANPRAGIELMVDTGMAEHVLPEVPAMRLEIDEHHRHKDVYEHSLTVLDQAVDLEAEPGCNDPTRVAGPSFVLRFAALMHDIGKPATRKHTSGGGVSFHHHEVVGAKMTAKRMKKLRFDSATTKAVARLVELHLRFHGYGDQAWTDSAVRRYVTDAGDLLPHLHALTRADCTTRNRRKAARLAARYDDLERRIADLAAQEELAAIRPDLDGRQIMEILGIPSGPLVGRAYKHLLAVRMEHGPQTHDEAVILLKKWWAEHGDGSVCG